MRCATTRSPECDIEQSQNAAIYRQTPLLMRVSSAAHTRSLLGSCVGRGAAPETVNRRANWRLPRGANWRISRPRIGQPGESRLAFIK